MKNIYLVVVIVIAIVVVVGGLAIFFAGRLSQNAVEQTTVPEATTEVQPEISEIVEAQLEEATGTPAMAPSAPREIGESPVPIP